MRFTQFTKRVLALLTAAFLLTLGSATVAQALSGPSVSDFSQNGTSVDLQGTGLSGVTNVLFDTTPATSFQVVSDSEVTAVAPALSNGHHEVSIVTSTTTIDTGFSYIMAPPGPIITSVTPTSGSTLGGTKVVVSGSGFSFLTAASVGGVVTSDVLVSDSEVDLVTAAHAAGPATVAITTLGGTATAAFTYNAPVVLNSTPLVVTSATPNHGFIGGNASVKIFGTGFSAVNSVTFNGTKAKSFNIVSDTEIDAVTPFVTKGGTGRLTVSTGSRSASTTWTYRYVNPWITTINPTNGSSNNMTTMTIQGFGFTGVTRVTINGQPVKILTIADKTIVVQLPKHHHGTVSLRVTNPAGTSNPETYTFS
jgi:hypothetical protein